MMFKHVCILFLILLVVSPCSVMGLNKPTLKVSPLKIDLGNVEKNKSKEFSIAIKNIGGVDLKWKIGSDTSWLVANHDLSRDAYTLWLKTWMKNCPNPIDLNGDGAIDYFPPKIEPLSCKAWRAERRDLPDGSTRRETDNVSITAYTVDLPDGEYKGTVFVTSDVERKEIEVSMKVVSLEYITITPVSITIRAGRKRRFRATGVWSDGSRTDLSGSLDGQWVVSDPSIGRFLYGKPVFEARKTGGTEIKKIRGDIVSDVAQVTVEEDISQPLLVVSPREVDLGAIGPGESSNGIFSLKNFGSGVLNWSAGGPSGWSLNNGGKLSGTVRNTSGYIKIYLRSLKENDEESCGELGKEEYSLYPVQLRLESAGSFVTYVRDLPAGNRREMIKLTSDAGVRRVFLKFEVAQAKSGPSMKAEPLGIDAGIVEPDRQLIRKVKLRNGGRDTLKWEARLQRNSMTLKKGRYVSLLNEDICGKDAYLVPGHLKDSVDISGVWSENEGYPYNYGKDAVLKYSFSGTGIAVFIWKDFDGGNLLAYIDDKLMKEIDCYAEKSERAEVLIAEGLGEEDHLLTLVSQEGHVVIEGARVYGEDIMRGPPGWIEIFPNTGTTTGETDYVNIMINSRGLKPGYYCENILFSSNGGTAVVEVTLQVSKGKVSEILNVYRYVRGSDYLFMANPEHEGIDSLRGYKRQGVAFRLFSKGTPGTTEFFRWHNSSKADHFYSYDRDGGGKSLKGYVFEGSIGNIATTRLSRTKELYRWFNLFSGGHFYTTDSKGEGCSKRGYKYDGIAGYVR